MQSTKSKKGGKAALEKHSCRCQDIAEGASDRNSWIRPIPKFQEQHQKDRACVKELVYTSHNAGECPLPSVNLSKLRRTRYFNTGLKFLEEAIKPHKQSVKLELRSSITAPRLYRTRRFKAQNRSNMSGSSMSSGA